MDEKEYGEFNWTALFIVTACSSFIFSLAIKILDGNFSYLLLVIAAITLFLSVFSWLTGILAEQYNSKRKKSSYSTDSD